MAFSNSHFTFEITGLANPPFVFRRRNVSKSVKCPYAAVSYDERITNLGANGFLACDGVNVQRYDIPIIDYYETQISQQYFNQDFSQRYDNLNQTWMLYPSYDVETVNPKVGGVAPGSDETLVYNFIENTWATYSNTFPMTCLGLFNVTAGTAWNELTEDPNDTWAETASPWASYSTQSTAPILLGGDTTGNVYHLDNSLSVRDGEGPSSDGTSFNVSIKTTRWNPFMKSGQKTQFGYIDIYYRIAYREGGDPIQVTLNFYVDNNTNTEFPAMSRTFTFDGPENADYAWKRVYCNLTGEFIQMGIDPSEDAPIQILGFVLWARPAGRLTP